MIIKHYSPLLPIFMNILLLNEMNLNSILLNEMNLESQGLIQLIQLGALAVYHAIDQSIYHLHIMRSINLSISCIPCD